jgi:regulator of nucleoside diphosphate kinase
MRAEKIVTAFQQEPEVTALGMLPGAPAMSHLRCEALRPLCCCLTAKDYTLLEGHLIKSREIGSGIYRLLGPLIRAKLADASIVLTDDVDFDVATGNSRVVFSADAGADESRVLVHWDEHYVVGLSLPIDTLLGTTLLGMRAGQRAPLLRADGTIGTVLLRSVAYQPEAARRRAAGRIEDGGP